MILQCELCPKGCVMKPGEGGECRARINIDGRLIAATYGFPCSVNVDPVEKKPLFHFLPGTPTLSLATAGCNLHCKNCQNWEISQGNPEDVPAASLPPEQLPTLARRFNCPSISYTYTDPIIYYEYTYDASLLARRAGLKNILVTAGYCNREPWEKLCRAVDGAHLDLKSMSEKFYREICGATLQPVLNNLIAAKALGVHIEVTHLVIPTLNDSEAQQRQLARWMIDNLGRETPLHLLRFFPQYQMKSLPPTPAETLIRARQLALAEGLYFVYIGNLDTPEGENTYCPKCRRLLIERAGMGVRQNLLVRGGCPYCHRQIAGRWS